jgi:type I restriction enzyme S subunit
VELKPGYKQTEIGVIPDDWEVKNLFDVCDFKSGKAHEPFISELGKFVCVNSKFISSEGRVRKYSTKNLTPAKANDILMVMSDLPNGKALAKAYLATEDDILAVNQRVCSLTSRGDHPKFLFYILNRNKYFLKFDDGVNQTHLLNRVFSRCKISIPNSVKEQKAIAEALSDVDAQIDSLEALLTKKRNFKTGVMQELLTGRTRLPGFSGEWKEVRLGEFSEITMGQSPDSLFYNTNGYGVPLIQGNADIDNRKSIVRVWTTVASKKAKKGDVLLTVRAPVGAVAIASQDVCLGRGVCALAPKSGDMMFLFHSLVKNELKWKVFEQGSTFTAANSNQVADFTIDVPQEFEEQKAIAEVLSDMDDEIEKLEKRLAKTRDLKQGMAQELLTGRTRLV